MRSSASSTWRISLRSSWNRAPPDNSPTVSAFRSRTQSSAVGPVTSSSHRYGSSSGPSGARLILPVSPPGADLAHASADRVTATGPPGAQPAGGGRGGPDGGGAAGD